MIPAEHIYIYIICMYIYIIFGYFGPPSTVHAGPNVAGFWNDFSLGMWSGGGWGRLGKPGPCWPLPKEIPGPPDPKQWTVSQKDGSYGLLLFGTLEVQIDRPQQAISVVRAPLKEPPELL